MLSTVVFFITFAPTNLTRRANGKKERQIQKVEKSLRESNTKFQGPEATKPYERAYELWGDTTDQNEGRIIGGI